MKRIGQLFLVISMFLFPLTVFASDTYVSKEVNDTVDLAPNAKSAILMDVATGEILYEKNSHEKLAPASMTKMMSMLLILEHIESGAMKWDDIITVSENASKMGGSQILLETGEQMSVEDLFKGVAVASGNDAVVALAEAVAGNVETFVDMMNKKAKELGLKDTVFKNPHGLDDANHYSTAYDMAKIGFELVKHEKVLEFTSIYEDYLRKGTEREFWLVNTNRLVKFNPNVDGLKTGYTEGAGYCLTATAKKNNMRLLTTVMGEESVATRTSEVTALLDYGYANYKIDTLIKKDAVVDTVSFDKAKQESASIVPIKEMTKLSKKTKKLGNITYDLHLKDIKIPVKKGDVVVNMDILEDGKVIDKVDVTVSENIDKIDFLGLFSRYFSDIVTGNVSI